MAGSGLTRRSGDDYAQALAALLPVGAAWPRDPQSDLMKLVSGQAQVWGDVDGRAFDLLETETDPRYADEMLGDWERAFGLPDGCVPAPTTIQGRRDALIAKMTSVGGQSRPFFVGLALSLGYEIEIVEWSPYQGGISRCGDTRPYTGSRKWLRGGSARGGIDHHLTLPSDLKVTGPYRWRSGRAGNRAWWRVIVKGRTLTWLRGGRGRAGIDRQLRIDPPYRWFRAGAGGGRAGTDRHLTLNRAADLECLFNRYKPAHTVLTFRYGGQPITAY